MAADKTPDLDPILDEPDTLADFDDNGDFSEFDQKKSNQSFGALVKNNPLLKIGMVVAALVIIGGALMLFGGDKPAEEKSRVAAGEELKSTPGTAELSPEMRQALEESNQQRFEQAVDTGQSVLPTPIDPPKERLPVPTDGAVEEDPLLRWRQMQEERMQAEQQQLEAAQTAAPQAQAAQPQGPDPAIANLAGAMSSAMGQILTTKESQPLKYMEVTNLAQLMAAMQQQASQQASSNQQALLQQAGGAQGLAQTGIVDPATGQMVQPPQIAIKAGTIEYGQMITEANSDIPGPIVALLASGPFRGSRMLGSFSKQKEFLVISFNTLVDKKTGTSIPIEAYALDPNTTLSGMATEVDQRYWTRVILPAAAEFVQGLGEAVAENGQTVVTVSGDTVIEERPEIDTRQEISRGAEKAADRVAELLDQKASETEVLVRVAAGTPMGILFTTPVTDQDVATGMANPKASGGFRGQQEEQNFQNRLIQSLSQNQGQNNGQGTSGTDTETLLRSLRDLQGQQSLQGATGN